MCRHISRSDKQLAGTLGIFATILQTHMGFFQGVGPRNHVELVLYLVRIVCGRLRLPTDLRSDDISIVESRTFHFSHTIVS